MERQLNKKYGITNREYYEYMSREDSEGRTGEEKAEGIIKSLLGKYTTGEAREVTISEQSFIHYGAEPRVVESNREIQNKYRSLTGLPDKRENEYLRKNKLY